MNWSPADYVFAAALIGGVGLAYWLAVRTTDSRAYRAGAAVALAAAFLLVWINAAVGIIGSEDHPANWMYFGVLAVGMAGALVARFRPRGMARALAATAATQALVVIVALVAGLGFMPQAPAGAFFTALWLLSAWLFRRAARAN